MLVVRIIFDNLAARNRLMELLDADTAKNALINRMLGELKLPLRHLRTDLCNHDHRRLPTGFTTTSATAAGH
jgi:hypothetical protein